MHIQQQNHLKDIRILSPMINWMFNHNRDLLLVTDVTKINTMHTYARTIIIYLQKRNDILFVSQKRLFQACQELVKRRGIFAFFCCRIKETCIFARLVLPSIHVCSDISVPRTPGSGPHLSQGRPDLWADQVAQEDHPSAHSFHWARSQRLPCFACHCLHL